MANLCLVHCLGPALLALATALCGCANGVITPGSDGDDAEPSCAASGSEPGCPLGSCAPDPYPVAYCDGTGDCASCSACALFATCGAPLDACRASPECVALRVCISHCDGEDCAALCICVNGRCYGEPGTCEYPAA
ncbi:MAG: hypothetical protein HY744_21635 [Deltaproteobacteria bacterium]|nr:hypothetical protein [Deltaproteobacteria bacterium]